MGDTLHKMQVIIEATTEPLKKGMENSRREVKKSVEEIQKETEKVKNPFKGMESKALQPVRNTLNKIREMLSRNPVKNFQIKAGIKVPTEEYAELQKNLSKAQQSLEKLQEKQHKFENTGKSKENQQWKSLVVDITRAEKKLSEYKDAAAKMETSGTAFKQTPTDEYREIRNSVKSLNEEIEKYEKKGEKLEAMGVKKEIKQWGHNCPTSLMQLAVSKVLDLTSDFSVYERNRNLLYECLTDCGFEVVKPEGTFYIFPKAPEADAAAFCQKALQYDLVLVPADSFGCPGYFRMAYCIDTEKVERSLPVLRKMRKEIYG